MKIDGNLRQAIRSACNAQKDTDWTEVQKQQQAAIQSFLDSKEGKRAKTLARSLRGLREQCNKLAKALCDDFGLYVSDKKLEIASCDGSKERYLRAGGTFPKCEAKWNFDAKMAEVANASEADAKIILRGIGINWE